MESIRVVMVDALPKPGTEAFSQFGGALINVYTTELAEKAALVVAEHEVNDAGWFVMEIEDSYILNRSDFPGPTCDGLAYFEQALVDGVVLVIHSYPAAPQDESHVH